MNRIATNNLGISTQRGFWLRCFLGRAICVGFLAGIPEVLIAQVQIPGPEHLTHVEGLVVNSAGQPAANVEVTLDRDDKVMYRAKTNGAGEFHFDHVSGRFIFKVARTQYAPATREVVVTDELVTRAERKKLYVILGPGACMDECSAVLTSKREFEKSIREKNRK
jgi:hypothetical protein